ncbi:MAG: MFS transporter [Brevinematales bacterium]|nr:MFS transporter [Brevinematales bacterium]
MSKFGDESKIASIKFVVLLGLVSLFADVVYETARGIMGPYLGYLGANAFAVGIIFGFGEFLGYVLRIVAGVLVDRSRKYWTFVFLGYFTIVSIPLLAIADYWVLAGILIVLERIGKAVRTPSRDTLISIYSRGIGKGLSFGIHEMTDQIGAVLGPLLFYLLLTLGLGYKIGFLLLFVPFVVVMVLLVVAKNFASKIDSKISEDKNDILNNKSSSVYLYLGFILFTSLGFVGFPIVSFHSVKVGLISDNFVPLIYSFVMILDALVAMPIGLLYDKVGIKVMIVIPVLVILTVVFGFSNHIVLLFIGLGIWGVVMSAYETIIRAYIGDSVSISDRGKFYGIFNTLLGVGFGIGNSLVGYLYEVNKVFVILFVVIVEILALIVVTIHIVLSSRKSA